MATIRRLMLKGIAHNGGRVQAHRDLERPIRISQHDLDRALDAALQTMGIGLPATPPDDTESEES